MGGNSLVFSNMRTSRKSFITPLTRPRFKKCSQHLTVVNTRFQKNISTIQIVSFQSLVGQIDFLYKDYSQWSVPPIVFIENLKSTKLEYDLLSFIHTKWGLLKNKKTPLTVGGDFPP